MKPQPIYLNTKRNVYLEPYHLECGNEFRFTETRPAVLILPGGGYRFCSEREGAPIAYAYNAKGYHAFVLHYSVGEQFAWPHPLEDYEQAMNYITLHAKEWGVDITRIAVVGFSAGGHLAAAASTISERKPFAAILGYPAIDKSTVQSLSTQLPDITDFVDKYTCPTFIFTTRNDQIVHVDNTINYIHALSENNIDFESHIYAFGNHGYSLGTFEMIGSDSSQFAPRTKHWIHDSAQWLDELFTGTYKSFKDSSLVHDQEDKMLSTKNSIRLLLSNPQASEILETIFGPITESSRIRQAGPMQLEALLNMMGKGQQIDALNQKLGRIPNR